jgi:hypothetical protein
MKYVRAIRIMASNMRNKTAQRTAVVIAPIGIVAKNLIYNLTKKHAFPKTVPLLMTGTDIITKRSIAVSYFAVALVTIDIVVRSQVLNSIKPHVPLQPKRQQEQLQLTIGELAQPKNQLRILLLLQLLLTILMTTACLRNNVLCKVMKISIHTFEFFKDNSIHSIILLGRIDCIYSDYSYSQILEKTRTTI